MQTLGVRSGWVFFEHAGSAVAVDLRTGDVTDVFSADTLPEDAASAWSDPESGPDLARAEILARSTLASSLDDSLIFTVPKGVRASAQRALELHEIYQTGALLASAVQKVAPQFVRIPRAVREAAAQGGSQRHVPESQYRSTLATAREVPMHVVERINLFFSRHDKASTQASTWESWGGDAGRDWASRVTNSRDRVASSVTEALANHDQIDYDTLKLLPRAFSVVPSPHELSCSGDGQCGCGGSRDSARYPSARAITFAALGGQQAKDWAEKIVREHEVDALLAAGYDPDAGVVTTEEATVEDDVFDPGVKHVYAPIPTYPGACIFCMKDELDEIHDESAVDYEQADISPEDAHYFSATVDDDEKCAICGEPVDDTLHKQAALAAYYANKADWDKRYAETQEYWAGKDQGVAAAASVFGIDWLEDADPGEIEFLERAVAVDDEMDDLAWQRRNEFDDMCYYAAFSGDDALTVDQIYVSDGPTLFRYEPLDRTWIESSLDSIDQIFEIDDDSAHAAIRQMSLFPGRPVDLRDVDPGEAFLHESVVPILEEEGMSDRTVVSSARAAFADYTPEERSQNARKQVRDRSGRFAKAGSRIAGPKGAGTVTRINPDTQEVEIKYDSGGSDWVAAGDTQVVPKTPSVTPENLRGLIESIPGKPRATAGTPKATLKTVLQPMDAATLQKVIADYAAVIEADRLKAQRIDERNRRTVSAAGEPSGSAIESPEKSDIAPLYLAVVDEADPSAVLELLAMTPASTTGTETVVWRRDPTGWVRDDDMLRKLKSSAPPPVVKLDQAAYLDTIAQVDAFYKTPEGQAPEQQPATPSPPATAPNPPQATSPVAAAVSGYGPHGELLPVLLHDDPAVLAAGIPGIADTPGDRANVNRLKRYWLVGGGALKIRWNTPGDMKRCMRLLKKYMQKPGMSEGYCAELHHTATGMWPGDRRNRNMGLRASGLFDTKILASDEVIRYSALVAAAEASVDGVEVLTRDDAQRTAEIPVEGAPFLIPMLAPIGVRSGDGRTFRALSLSMRDLPLPLMWQVQTQEGHDASVIVGRIDSYEIAPDGSLINARGVFDVGPYGKEAERLVRHKFLRGVSVDLDEFEAEARPHMPDESDEMGLVRIKPDEMTITNGRVMGATLVAKPAFQQCTIELDEFAEEVEEMADGTYIGTPETDAEQEAMVASALVAAGIPLHPPVEWFDNPKLTERTPLTIEDDGRVFGHIATWDREHIGLPFSTTPPRSRSNYAYFHTGILRTQEGVDVPVGQITLAGGHADLNASAAMAVKHYDDTASAMCDVHCGEDAFGIWVAGALRPSVTGEQIRAIRASAPSGDWRPINGRLELVAVCQVNVPGFPITRARVASGHVFALVAAGTSTLNRIRATSTQSKLDALLERIEALEAPQREALAQAREAALARVNAVRQEKAAKASERFHSLASLDNEAALFKDYSPEKRDEYAKKGWARKDGSYPIANEADLKRAVRAYGRAAEGDRADVRRHIKKRARALGKPDMIPDSWKSMSTIHEDFADAVTRALLAAGGRYPNGEPWDPTNHPRDEAGRFRQVIAKLKSDLEGEVGTADVVAKLNEAEDAEHQGNPKAAQDAAKEVLDLVDTLARSTDDPDVVKSLRDGYTSLAESIANLPLTFGDQNSKYRYSDLPDQLKGLIDDLLTRAKSILDDEAYDKAASGLISFKSGVDVLSQPDISTELSKLLRFLI